MHIYIAIPVFNRVFQTIKCLDSLYVQHYKNFTIIVLDDRSTDGTYDVVSKNYADVILLKGNGNLWWTEATNRCIRYALSMCSDQDLLLTLNNDLTVQPDYLESLIRVHLEHPRALIGSLAVNMDDPTRVAYAGEKWCVTLAKKRLNVVPGTRVSDLDEQKLFSSDVLPGRGTLIPVSVIKEVGLFDSNRLPHYGADYDFSLRAKKAGYKLIVSSSSVVYADIDNKGYNSVQQEITLRAFILSHFHRKSRRNLSCRFWLAVKHVPWFYLPVYLLIDELRRTVWFFREYYKKRSAHKRAY
jgi:GT2 family glycosyltransferase